jgi:galactonate dehydratase
MAIAGLCAAAAVPVAPHHSAALGIALAAGLHVSAAAEQCEAFEFQAGGFAAANAILKTPLAAEPGFMPLPSGPGLGITVDEDAVERFRLS